MSSTFFPPLIQQINSDIGTNAGVELYVLRLDIMHPQINGNKWFKLKYNLVEAKERNLSTILTFGGAYSNHIYATAAAGNLFGFRTIGVIRGEENIPLNPTLQFAVAQGMELVYIDRQTYKKRHTKELQNQLTQQFGEVFIIPEGGGNLNGMRGCIEILQTVKGFNTICLACGTGTTLAGMTLSLSPEQKVIGFPVLKGGDFLKEDINNLLTSYLNSGLPAPVNSPAPWQLVSNYHFGGYAQVNNELKLFCQDFQAQHDIPLDYIYTGKMFYGVMDLIAKGFFKSESLLLIHTGGLQGNQNNKIPDLSHKSGI
ncbi:MAG: 1-aminocyclopropane-1-carboxylate deaminase/D-cysteine desulfhydrase [Dolichospermum sp. DET50]|nr:1-aminocyclopropane-1-carboxylate deaminase/D-cysteine desulfhydrase [Dolichospermum sp. DET66]MBS3033293.1 1-aminocyclopropane-1-carboxylate deaminase/D-cysteine desulfhydrase [Dolichospermum sp. DET67]MBS3038497.1 1-aminocyclopropane-1-carboxylate deaminase/D-cysteine desulfhydrase [Dolichospermum sp. DET50]QSX70376.1 MAG: 1-aminocyclopropane-1-carboxylate deaminase/D-cysteine desulfhydrase [Dolichospermum sp. DET69]